MDTHLTLVYKIVNQDVNVTFEDIPMLPNDGTRLASLARPGEHLLPN